MGRHEVTLEGFPEEMLSGMAVMAVLELRKSWALVPMGSFSSEKTQPLQGKPR